MLDQRVIDDGERAGWVPRVVWRRMELRTPCRRWRRASAAAAVAALARRCARPAAHVPPSSTRASGSSRVDAELCAHASAHAIEQRHGQRAPLDDDLVAGAVACSRRTPASRGTSTPRSMKQAAVAVLGQAGQRVEPGDREARALERLEQRVGRATATACGTAPGRRSGRPGMARQQSPRFDAAELDAARPYRPQRLRSNRSTAPASMRA